MGFAVLSSVFNFSWFSSVDVSGVRTVPVHARFEMTSTLCRFGLIAIAYGHLISGVALVVGVPSEGSGPLLWSPGFVENAAVSGSQPKLALTFDPNSYSLEPQRSTTDARATLSDLSKGICL